jgi:hypothetical protein
MPLVGAVSIQGGVELEGVRDRLLELIDRYSWFGKQVQGPVERPGPDGRPRPTWLLSLVPRDRLERLLQTLFDEREFLSPHGIRSLSRIHAERPVVMDLEGQRFEVHYLPGESDSWSCSGCSGPTQPDAGRATAANGATRRTPTGRTSSSSTSTSTATRGEGAARAIRPDGRGSQLCSPISSPSGV